MNGELDFVGGEAEGQLGRVSHRKRAVELCRKCVEVLCKSGSGGGSVGDEEGDGTSLVGLGCDREGEGSVCISEDTRRNVRECGSYQGGLGMFRGGRARNVEPSFCRGERLGGQDFGHRVAD